jgi:hypothetical protein
MKPSVSPLGNDCKSRGRKHKAVTRSQQQRQHCGSGVGDGQDVGGTRKGSGQRQTRRLRKAAPADCFAKGNATHRVAPAGRRPMQGKMAKPRSGLQRDKSQVANEQRVRIPAGNRNKTQLTEPRWQGGGRGRCGRKGEGQRAGWR